MGVRKTECGGQARPRADAGDSVLAAFLKNLAGALVLVIATAAAVIGYSRSVGVFNAGIEERYGTAGLYVRDHLPANAAVLSSLHSGSVRFYSGRLSVRFDFLSRDNVQPFLAFLRSRGYEPWLLLDDSEYDEFNRLFGGTPLVKQLSAVNAGIQLISIYRITGT